MVLQRIRRLFNTIQPLTLRREVISLCAECEALRDQIDFLKSSLEIPGTLCDEFRDWRMRTPIPTEPFVSVCVATYNRARLLTERCIPSILSQTYPNLELIVVGDGCSDETAELVAKIADPRLKFVNLPEHGCYPDDPHRGWMVAGTPAMNHALSLARGDYVTHLDDDDEYLPERLEKLVAFAIKNQCDLVWHPFWMENPKGGWRLIDATAFRMGQVTTASVFYRAWFTRIKWDMEAHRLWEPGDWNRYRKVKYLGPVSMRCPEPLLKHYRQHTPTA